MEFGEMRIGNRRVCRFSHYQKYHYNNKARYFLFKHGMEAPEIEQPLQLKKHRCSQPHPQMIYRPNIPSIYDLTMTLLLGACGIGACKCESSLIFRGTKKARARA
jgi:hypothetical protein